MDAFIISSLPLRVDEEMPSAGSLCSTSVTQLHRYYGPIRHPHASAPLPGVVGYRNGLPPGISPRGVEGFSSCFTCPCHRATVEHPAGVDWRLGQITPAHAAFAETRKARPPDLVPFEATLRSLALRPGDSLTAPESGFVDELQVLGFPHTCHPSYGGLASTPAGLTFLLNTLAFIGHTEFRYTTRRGGTLAHGCEQASREPGFRLDRRFGNARTADPADRVLSRRGVDA